MAATSSASKVTSKHDIDRRRIFVSADVKRFDYQPLQNADWLTLQSALGRKIDSATRDKLTNITRQYSFSLRPSTATKSASAIVKELDKWCRQSRRLQRVIWIDTPELAPLRRKQTPEKIIKRYFGTPPTRLEKNYSLALLSRYLAGAVAVTEHFRNSLSARLAVLERKTELWFLWAAIVLKILEDAGFSVRHPTRTELVSPVVSVLEKLQLTVPTELQLRAKRASLRKGAVHAFKISRRNQTSTLKWVFDAWIKGDLEYNKRRSEHGRRLLAILILMDRFQKQIVVATKSSGGSKRISRR